MKTAVVCLATGEYWKGAQVLFYTLRKAGRLPDWVDAIALGAERCDYAKVVPIDRDYSWVPVSQKNFPRVADKFFALTLGYDRTILIDADVLCVGDCSLLWSDSIGRLPFYAVRDPASVVYYRDKMAALGLRETLNFNGGVMVFSGLDAADVLDRIADGTLGAYDGGDQGYLNHYVQWKPVEFGFLPAEYNAITDQNGPIVPDHAKKLIHFTGGNVNPWAPRVSPGDRRIPYLNAWRRAWEECA